MMIPAAHAAPLSRWASWAKMPDIDSAMKPSPGKILVIDDQGN